MQHGVNPKLSTNVHQDLLLEKLRALFPEDRIYQNVKKKISLKFPAGTFMQLDIWIPRLRICFEFQDSYHYVSTWYSHISREKIWQKDSLKKDQTLEKGVDLIAIPCWWDGTIGGLAATINFQRPDLLLHFDVVPVHLNPPLDFFKSPLVPNVGELMLASFPKKYPDFRSLISPYTWWMGEKYDGLRFCWNPYQETVYTRTAREVELHDKFISSLPPYFIEGEIWFGRGEFSRSFALLEGDFFEWDALRMNVFDSPSIYSSLVPFENRYARVLESFPPSHPFLLPVARLHCTNSMHLSSALHRVVQDGGEGIILRKFFSGYYPGRSTDIVKLKNAERDSEGIVAVVGKSGSVKVKLPNGIFFVVPHQNVLIPTPHVGAVVSFSFETYWRRDAPLGPKIFRIRTDVSWGDLVENHRRGWWRQPDLSPSVKEKSVARRTEYWTDKRMRLFLENFAKNRNMDPLKPSTWLQTSYTEIRKVPGGRFVLEKFKTGYFPTLLRLFPELKQNKALLRRDYWGDKANRVRFFEKYAEAKGFDPLNPLRWYDQTVKQILHAKGGGVLDYYNFKLGNALVDLFPQIGILPSKFGKYNL